MKYHLKFNIPLISKPSVLGLSVAKIKDIQFHSNTQILIKEVDFQSAQVEVWGLDQQGCDLAFKMTMHAVEHNKASLAHPTLPQTPPQESGVLDDIFTFLSEVESKKC